MTMASLFDTAANLDTITVAPYRAGGPSTSCDAAENVKSLAESHLRCLHALVEAGDDGLTDDELFAVVKCPTISERYIAGTRRGTLRDLGLVERTERKRQSAKGRAAFVWVATAEGRQVAA